MSKPTFYGQNKEDVNPYPHISPTSGPANTSNKPQTQGNVYNPRGSVLLKKEQEPPQQQTWFTRCCPCLQLSYYQSYFTVNNNDVIQRLLINLKFWQGGFFEPLEQSYDMYGPFWLYTTMIFLCSAVNNVLMYLNNKQNFQYNFKVIGVALTVFYLLGMGGSAIIGIIFGCIGINSKTPMIMSLYGYSMANYVLCVILCMLNMEMLSWLLLLYAGGAKIAYIMKNMFEKLDIPPAKKFMITIIIIVEAGVQCLIIKFAFIVHSGQLSYVLSHMSAHASVPLIHEEHFMQNRHFSL